jgi:hypothetical protein
MIAWYVWPLCLDPDSLNLNLMTNFLLTLLLVLFHSFTADKRGVSFHKSWTKQSCYAPNLCQGKSSASEAAYYHLQLKHKQVKHYAKKWPIPKKPWVGTYVVLVESVSRWCLKKEIFHRHRAHYLTNKSWTYRPSTIFWFRSEIEVSGPSRSGSVGWRWCLLSGDDKLRKNERERRIKEEGYLTWIITIPRLRKMPTTSHCPSHWAGFARENQCRRHGMNARTNHRTSKSSKPYANARIRLRCRDDVFRQLCSFHLWLRHNSSRSLQVHITRLRMSLSILCGTQEVTTTTLTA